MNVHLPEIFNKKIGISVYMKIRVQHFQLEIAKIVSAST